MNDKATRIAQRLIWCSWRVSISCFAYSIGHYVPRTGHKINRNLL